MALRPILSRAYNLKPSSPSFKICSLDTRCFKKPTQELVLTKISRRGMVAGVLFLSKQELMADGIELRMVAPEQTVEEAESGIRSHAQALLEVKGLIETESWGEAQKMLRLSSSYLKQDIYTIIQGKPGSQRPKLRKLYSNLFNNVTRVRCFSPLNL